MAGEERLRWILELQPDATSLFAVADEIEARFNKLKSEAGSRRAPGLLGTGSVKAEDSVAGRAGETEALARVVQQRLESLAKENTAYRGLVNAAKARIDPTPFRADLTNTINSRNLPNVGAAQFNAFADRGVLRTADAIESANGILLKATTDLAKTRLEEAVAEAEAADQLANNPNYVKNVIKKRSAQQYSSAQIEEGLANEATPAGKQYNESLARVRIAQEQVLAQLKERLASEGLAADGVATYAGFVARATIAQAAITAQTEKVLSEDDGYIGSLAKVKVAHAQEAAGVEALLAAQTALGDEYIGAKAALAASRRSITAGVEASKSGVLVTPGEPVEVTEANTAVKNSAKALEAQALILKGKGIDVGPLTGLDQTSQSGLVAAGQKELSNREKLAEVTAQLARLREAQLNNEVTDLDIQEQIKVSEGELNLALKRQVAAANRAAYDARVATNPAAAGTGFQRIQAGIANRDGSFRDPTEFQTLAQFTKSRFLTSAGFAVSGLATFAAFSELQKMLTGSQALELALAGVKAQFDSLGQGSAFGSFREGIRQIAADTGTAADQVARLASQFKGALGAGAGGTLSDSGVLKEVKSATEFAKLSGVSLADVGQNMLALAKTYGISVQDIGDKTIALFQRTGTPQKELVDALGQIAPIADQVGLSFDKTAAIIATASEYSGRSANVITQSLARVLTSAEANAGPIDLFFQKNAPKLEPQVIDALGAGQTGKVVDLIGQIYPKLQPGQKADIRNLLGRPRDIQDIVAVLENYNQVQDNTVNSQKAAGTQAKAYSDLQNTLGQQLSRVRAELAQFGEVLLRLGLSEALQEVVKVLGAIISAVGVIFRGVDNLNSAFGGVPGKIFGILAPLLLVLKAIKEIQVVGASAFATNALNRVPLVNVGQKTAAAAEAEAAATGGVGAGATPIVVPFSNEAARGEATNATPVVPVGGAAKDVAAASKGFTGSIKQFGTDLKASTAESTGVIASVKNDLGSAIVGLGSGLEAILAVGGPIATILAATIVLDTYSSEKSKVDKASKDYQSALDGASLKDLRGQLGNTSNDVKSSGFFGHLTKGFSDVVALGGITGTSGQDIFNDISYGVFGATPPKKDLQNAIAKKNSLFNAEALKQAFPNIQANLPGGKLNLDEALQGSGLSPKDLDALIAGGGNKDKDKALQTVFNRALKTRHDLGKIANALSESNDKVISDTKTAQAAFTSLKINEAQYNEGTLGGPQYLAALKASTDADKHVLDSLLAQGPNVDATAVDNAAKTYNADIQKLSAVYKGQFDAITGAAKVVSQLGGATTLQTDSAVANAAVAAINAQPIVPNDPNQLAAVGEYITKRQAFLTDQAKGADSLGAAIRITSQGSALPQKFVTILNLYQQSTASAKIQNAVAAVKASGGILDKFDINLASVLSDGGTAIKALLERKIAFVTRLIATETANGQDTAKDVAALNALNTLLGSVDQLSGLGVNKRIKAPAQAPIGQEAVDAAAAAQNPVAAATQAQNTATDNFKVAQKNHDKQGQKLAYASYITATQQLQTAQDAIATSQVAISASLANGDPVAQAQASIDQATLQINQARARGDEAGVNAGIAAYNNAVFSMQQALEGIATAYAGVLSAAADGNAVKAAQASVVAAQIQAANAHGEADKLNALAAEITAEHALRDALNAVADAQKNIVLATLQAAGDVVGAAREQQKIDQQAFKRYLAQHPGSTVKNDATAAGLYQKTISDAAATRDAALNNAIGDINFGLATHKIFNSQAIARLKALDANQKLTKAEHQQLEEQIYNLQHQSQQDLQFNLPTDIKLPTLYEARRFNQGGGGAGGSNYQDNRKIEIHISTNAKLDGKDVQNLTNQVTDSVSAPPRYGVRPRTY